MKRSFEDIKNSIIHRILQNPKATLTSGFVLFFLFISAIYTFQADYTPRIWFAKDSKEIQNLDSFEKRFGGDQVIILGIYAKEGILTTKMIETVKEITEQMWQLPDVIRVESLSNFNHISSVDDDINIEPLIGENYNLNEVKKRVKETQELESFLISNDYEYALVYIKLKPLLGKRANFTKVTSELTKKLEKYSNQDIRFLTLGNVRVTDEFRKISISDNIKIIPFMFIFIILLLAINFRSIAGVIIPLVVSVLTIGASFGLMTHLGLVFNSVLAAIPGVLLAICLADTIHILASFYAKLQEEFNIQAALKYSLDKNFLATVLTSITTGISFITISYTELIPIRDLGILAAFGTVMAWVNTYLFLPSLIMLMPRKYLIQKWSKKHKKNSEGKASSKHTPGFALFIEKFKYLIIVSFVVVTSGSIWLSLQNEVNSDPLKYFSENTKLKQDYDFTQKHINSLRGLEVIIDSGKADGIKDPVFLSKVDQFSSELLKDANIKKLKSILDVIKKMNQTLNSDNPDFYTIPKEQNQIAEALFLYTLGLPPGLGIENQVSLDNRYLRVSVRWDLKTTKESVAKQDKIHFIAKKLGLNTKSGGHFPIYAQVNEKVVDSFFRSMAMAVILVSLIILLTFKNLLLSFLAMLPNVIPLFFGAAYMALNNIYIDIGTSIVSAICLGIAVDDTIHFITHFVANTKKHLDTDSALNETFASTGKALILTTVLLVAGFGSFVMADFLPNHYFGILCALVLSFALLTDLLLLPAILILWNKKSGQSSEGVIPQVMVSE